MRLNGWLRLWIVCVASWLVYVGMGAYEELSPLFTKKTYVLTKEGLGKAEFVFSAHQSSQEIQDKIRIDLIPLIEKYPDRYVGKVSFAEYDAYFSAHFWPLALHYVLRFLIPVLGICAFGLAFMWVLNGFRGTK